MLAGWEAHQFSLQILPPCRTCRDVQPVQRHAAPDRLRPHCLVAARRKLPARYIRLTLRKGPARGYALSEIEIRDLAFGASTNEFFAALAKQAPRGAYPRAFHAEQTYWTVVGVDGGHDSGLLSEDGALEVARGGFSVEPFLVDESGALSSWADAAITHSLEDGYLPMPRVSWQHDGLRLTTNAFAMRRESPSASSHAPSPT
jgi:hypothetical protein